MINRRQLKSLCHCFCFALIGASALPFAASAQMSMFGPAPKASANSSNSASTSGAPMMASAWKKEHKSKVRIISGDTDFGIHGTSYAGVQVQIAKGWKTYWRSPGDSGVPPSFDWSGSRNLKNIKILWPAPKKYTDQYSTSIGYKHEVILPLKITAKDPKKPVDVKLRFGYGICADICVPVETRLELTMAPKQYGLKTLLSRYQSMVPKPVNRTGKLVNGFSIEKIKVRLKGKSPQITIDANVPPDTKHAELYVETTNGFYLPLAVGERPSSGSHRRFHIDLTKGDPPAGLKGRSLAFTLVGDKAGIEYTHKIN